MRFRPSTIALDIAAARDVDNGIGFGGIQVAGGDHLRPAEPHNRIAVGMRIRPIYQLDPFAVEVVAETHALAVVGFRRERAQRRRRRSSRRRAHPVLHVFMRENRSADGGITNVAGDVAAGERTARRRQLLIAANVIGVRVGVDDVANRLGRRERIALDDDRRPRFGAPPERPPVGGRIKLSLQHPGWPGGRRRPCRPCHCRPGARRRAPPTW